MKMKLSLSVSATAWVATFILAWEMICGQVPQIASNWFFFVFFLVVAFVSGVISAMPPKVK